MAFEKVLPLAQLPPGTKKAVKVGKDEILLVRTDEGALHAVEAKCPHAGAPLEKGAVCNGRIICPWHTGTFELENGALVEPPPLRSLKSYAVKAEDGNILVEPVPRNQPSLANYDDGAPAAKRGEHQHFITIGAGAAAAAAVCTLRQSGFAGRITMIDPQETEPLDRTVLSKMALSGEKPLHEAGLWSPEEQKKLCIDRLVARVDSLQSERNILRLNDGTTLGYDAALLAPGGTPRWPGVLGEDLRHVHTIRHAGDIDAIDHLLETTTQPAEAVLLGDSFIAFEAASALKTRGLNVTVVCRSPQPFSKRFGEAPAQAIVGLHQAHGVKFKLGAEAREITRDAVLLKSGERLAAGLVLMAVGVRPATDFEHDIQIEENGTLQVDATLKIAPDLWAAGDAATVDGVHIEHWRLAEQHGRVAAFGMLQKADDDADNASLPRFEGVPFFWTFHFGKRFGYAGHAEHWDEVQVDGSLGTANFLAYYLQGDKVKAVFGCGRDAAMAMLAESLRRPLTLQQARSAAERA